MNKTDFHIHSDYSADSIVKLSEIVPLAIKYGYSEIAITEHMDLLPVELSLFGLPSMARYKKAIEKIRIEYPDIRIHYGIEVGDFHQVKSFADSLLSVCKFDLVLGSVHIIKDETNVAIPIKKSITPDFISDYYEQNLALVENCDIDVLAHLGVYKRYLESSPDESHCLPIIKKIMETIIKREIALELNYSAFRRTYQNLHPEPKYLKLYKDLGGKLVTIGSDSHTLDHFDDKYKLAFRTLTEFEFEHLKIK